MIDPEFAPLVAPDCPDIPKEFAAILHRDFKAAVNETNTAALEAYRGELTTRMRHYLATFGGDMDRAAATAKAEIAPWRAALDAARIKRLDAMRETFLEALRNLLSWWGKTRWNPRNGLQ